MEPSPEIINGTAALAAMYLMLLIVRAATAFASSIKGKAQDGALEARDREQSGGKSYMTLRARIDSIDLAVRSNQEWMRTRIPEIEQHMRFLNEVHALITSRDSMGNHRWDVSKVLVSAEEHFEKQGKMLSQMSAMTSEMASIKDQMRDIRASLRDR